MQLKISLIIVTYNRPDYLELILDSINRQKVLPHEVIIADDGSTKETKLMIEKAKKRLSFLLEHVWHEDKGFRIAAIRNKAVKKSSGNYLIFSDGDIFFHPNFISDISKNIVTKHAFIFSRTFLSKKHSSIRVKKMNVRPVIPLFSGEIEKNRLNSIRIPILNIFQKEERCGESLRGGLLGIQKSDLIDVNGWNEEFEGWGKEDTELIIRIMNNNIIVKKLKFQALTYHLWHEREVGQNIEKNQKILDAAILEKRIKCRHGLTDL